MALHLTQKRKQFLFPPKNQSYGGKYVTYEEHQVPSLARVSIYLTQKTTFCSKCNLKSSHEKNEERLISSN